MGCSIITNATLPELVIPRKGTYRIRVYESCDTLEASVTAEPVLGNQDGIPNAFSPNGDGKNESFQLADKLVGSKLTIYNRWGKVVYQSDNYQNDWGGQEQVGIYYYVLCVAQPLLAQAQRAGWQ